MSATDGLPNWLQYGGWYRNVDDVHVPWVNSPPWKTRDDPSTWMLVKTFEPPKPSHAPVEQPVPVRKRRILYVVKRWIVGAKRNEPTPDVSGETRPTKPLPQQVELREWKAWGYYAHPIINGVEVCNYPATRQPPSSVNVEALVASLKSPRGTQHPELWIPGIEHPALPPRPSRWPEPVKGKPLPFPWECQLNPFLQHVPVGPTPLCWHLGLPLVNIGGTGERVIPLTTADKSQPATWPLVTHMYINGIAEDSLPVFSWPIMVYNARGVKCEDIFDAIYKNFQEYVTQTEYQSWEDIRKVPARVAFEARLGQVRDERLRRIDYLGTHHMFRGLEPHPNREGWMMFVGLV